MNKLLFFVACFFVANFISAQTAPNKYWVQFTDKDNTPYSIENPEEFLSQKALERRERQNIPIDELDLPVDPEYIQAVGDIDNVSWLHQSRWFNALTIYTEDSLAIESILDLPFVLQVKEVSQFIHANPKMEAQRSYYAHPQSQNEYGKSWEQIEMIGLHTLHELGYYGQEMEIAVLDAGFRRSNILPALSRVFDEDRIRSTIDFANFSSSEVYNYSNHGTSVLSIMASYYPDSIIGSAYLANYHLIRTEETGMENIIEEDNWVVGAEYADYIGADILNTSLGYSLFDDSTMSHVYADLDGNSTRITIATDIAASKGMIPITSAGNEGNSEWHFITAPADADSCLTIGAVNQFGLHAPFSSFGPSADGRVKPDIVAMGWNTAYATQDSLIARGNGTSFSAPVIAGATACLWQAHPEKSNMEIMEAIRLSASLYDNPNDSLGYGIPNFWLAHQLLSEKTSVFNKEEIDLVEIFPNPFSDHVNLLFNIEKDESFSIEIFNSNGELIFEGSNYMYHNDIGIRSLNQELRSLSNGVYILFVEVNGQKDQLRIVKIQS